MALRWMDGFETYGALTPDAAIPTKYNKVTIGSGNGSFVSGTSTRFNVGQALDWSGTTFKTPTLATHATWIVGMAFMDRSVVTGNVIPLIRIQDGNIIQNELRYTKSGSSGFFSSSSSGVVLATGSTAILPNSWYYIEYKVTINSSGSAELQINEITDISVSSVATQTSTNATANCVAFGSTINSGNGNIRMDDLYILDGSGGSNDDFLGDSVVETILPNAAGTTTQWTAVPTQANYLSVKDVTPDSDTSYVHTSTGNNIDLYAMSDLGLVTGNIAGINVNILARNTDSTQHVLQRVVRTASTNYTGSSATVQSTTYGVISEIIALNPNTAGAWSAANINGMEAGVKYIS